MSTAGGAMEPGSAFIALGSGDSGTEAGAPPGGIIVATGIESERPPPVERPIPAPAAAIGAAGAAAGACGDADAADFGSYFRVRWSRTSLVIAFSESCTPMPVVATDS